jgi:hypothetical protein
MVTAKSDCSYIIKATEMAKVTSLFYKDTLLVPN